MVANHKPVLLGTPTDSFQQAVAMHLHQAAINQHHPILPYIDVPDVDDEDYYFIHDDITIEDLRARIARDQRLLSYLEEKQRTAPERKPISNNPANEACNRRRKLARSLEIVLKHMLKITRDCDVLAFVYGVVPTSGKTITASSDNLREWWQEKVRFDRNGPAAVSKYYSEFGTPGSAMNHIVPEEINPKSLMELQDSTLGSILSALMPHCEPPQRKYPLDRGVCPPWWPTGDEPWWPELGFPEGLSKMPYKKPHDLKKAIKTGVIIAVLKHMIPKAEQIDMIVRKSRGLQDKMTVREIHTWFAVVKHEEEVFWKGNASSAAPRPAKLVCEDLIEISSDSGREYSVCCGGEEAEVESMKDVRAGKRSAVDELKDSIVDRGVYLCANKGCRHHEDRFGYIDEAGRDYHMEFECKFKNKQLPPTPSSVALNSGQIREGALVVGVPAEGKQKIEKLMSSYADSVVNNPAADDNPAVDQVVQDSKIDDSLMSSLIDEGFAVPMEFLYPMDQPMEFNPLNQEEKYSTNNQVNNFSSMQMNQSHHHQQNQQTMELNQNLQQMEMNLLRDVGYHRSENNNMMQMEIINQQQQQQQLLQNFEFVQQQPNLQYLSLGQNQQAYVGAAGNLEFVQMQPPPVNNFGFIPLGQNQPSVNGVPAGNGVNLMKHGQMQADEYILANHRMG